jgi:plasmid stabilization system protein ParE
MTLRVVYRRAAQAEFEDAAVWYERQSTGLGEEFIREIEIAVDKAAESPRRYQIVFGDIRRTMPRRFPYCIYFRERRDSLVVLAVFHGKRDPRIWKQRTGSA